MLPVEESSFAITLLITPVAGCCGRKVLCNRVIRLRQNFCKGATFIWLGIIWLVLETKGKAAAQETVHRQVA